MIKIIKQWGGSVGILLDTEDLKIYDFKVGDIVDVEIVKISKKLPKNQTMKEIKENVRFK